MKPIHFEQVNATLAEHQPEYAELPVMRTTIEAPDGSEHPVIISCWQPNADEIAAIMLGRPVALIILGEVHPPVKIGVSDFENDEL